jgi:hypothetical protein
MITLSRGERRRWNGLDAHTRTLSRRHDERFAA